MARLSSGTEARSGHDVRRYERHRPEATLLYRLVEQHYPEFTAAMAAQGKSLPGYVVREFEDYLKCGRLEHGFLRVRCEACHAERLVAFSCKRRGFCPSCGARRMVESAALLGDDILPELPIRQWVVTFPHPLRFLFASRPEIMSRVLGIVYRTLAVHQVSKAGFNQGEARSGAVTLIQRFGSALNLNLHFHMLLLDGVYITADERLRFRRLKAPTTAELETLVHRLSERIGRHLERPGLLVRDLENAYLALEPQDDDGFDQILGS